MDCGAIVLQTLDYGTVVAYDLVLCIRFGVN